MLKCAMSVIILLIYVRISLQSEMPQDNGITNKRNVKTTVYEDEDDGRSSLVFVFDTTGSMHNDLKQLREGAEMILDTALEENNVIADFVFVPFHDPAVGPATVTTDKSVFKSALNIVRVHGGGDCPEKSLGGIQLALNVSRPRSHVYVFTDATAGDHRLVGSVLDAVQRKQSQVVFVLTGHCNDLHKPSYKVYQQIAAASSGQVFNLDKTNVHKVLDFVRSSIKGRTVNLGSIVNPAGYNYTQGVLDNLNPSSNSVFILRRNIGNSNKITTVIPVDSTLGEMTVSVSGVKPSIKVVNPSGEVLTGPPQLITTLDLAEIMIVKVLQPEPGNWKITTGSEESYSVRVVGRSNLTFGHGFSVESPQSMAEASYRPLQGTYNHMLISLTETDAAVRVNYAEILSLDGKTLFELPLREFDGGRKIYIADPFLPPDDFFYIAINGHDEYNQELRRIGATAVQAKSPDVPYLIAPHKVIARPHEKVVLKCKIESLVPVTAMWTKDTARIQPQISSLQSTHVEYVIDNIGEENVGSYRCVAKNVAGLSRVTTEVYLMVHPPQVTIAPENKTVQIGDNVTISCAVISEALILKFQLNFNGTEIQNTSDIHIDPDAEGFYTFNKTLVHVSERDSGIYSCIASNRAGQINQSTNLTVQTQPIAQILGPHTLIKLIHTPIQLVCHVENAQAVVWKAPNGTTVKMYDVDGSFNDMLDVRNVSEDGLWKCIAIRDSYRVTDSVEINILIKPAVTIEGPENVTILNGTSYEITCTIVAKPEPRIIWHRETERFLNNAITLLKPNVYKSVLTLDSTKESVNGTYFCFGENSLGIAQDSVVVSVRRKITLVEGFTDKSVQLYSQVEFTCHFDSYPPASIQWYHNATGLMINDNIHLSEDNSTMCVKRVGFEDLGGYSCVGDNGLETLSVDGSLNLYGLESPLLSKVPMLITTRKGKTAIITCRLMKGNPEPAITWQYRSNASENFTILPRNVVVSDDRFNLGVASVDVYNGGTYRCEAINVAGSDVYDALLVVQYPPELILDSIYSQEPLEIEGGQKVKFSCKSTANPVPIVVWTKDDHPITYSRNMYLAEESDLVIERASEYDTGLFTCTVTSALGSLRKNFTLIVYVPPQIAPPGIEPELEVLEGQLVELPCSARGVPKPSVQWLQNGLVVSERRKYIDDFGLRFVANLTDFGGYTCIARSKYGNTSVSFNVYIWVPPYIESPLETSKDVVIGSNVTLECNAVGFPIPTIVWEANDQVLEENTTNLMFNDFGNVFINNASAKHEGFYICVAENIAGVAKKSIFLNILVPPKILEDNYTEPYVAMDRDTALVIACRAIGKPKPFVVWSKDDMFLDNDSQYNIDIDGTLTIRSPSEEMSGLYTCIAKNVVGQVNKSIPVEIYSLPSQIQAEESQPTIITVLEGTNATIECPVHASRTDTVKWYKDANLLSHGHLAIPNITRHNASTYACVVTNAVGSVFSSVMVDVEWAPRFLETGGADVEVVRGDDWYFGCEVDAKPGARTKWLFNSKLLLGEDKDRLKLMNIQLYNTGTYKCIVDNPHGAITRQFTLDVLVPPYISEFDVLDVQLKEGLNATLECNAKGSPKPDIKWTFNNTSWHLQNLTITTTNISASSQGLYRCDAKNKAGATHIVYRVSVVKAAGVKEVVLFNGGEGETVVGGAEVGVGTHLRLSCISTGIPTPTTQWVHNGEILSENLPDISYADLVLDVAQMTDGGTYSCVVSNEGGVEERRVKLEVLEPPRIFQNLFENSPGSTTKLDVISGLPFYLHCHPFGNPVPEIYWFKDGLPLRIFDDTMVMRDYGEIVMVDQARFDQLGNYTCVARNKVGNTSVVYMVDVLVPPPTPKESTKQVIARIGSQLNLSCPVEGSPSPRVVWVKHPYSEVVEAPRVRLLDDNHTLLINNTEVLDSGKYSCIMTNKVGTTEVLFEVTIEKAPSIAGNVGGNVVESHVVALRRSVVLKCQADGNPPPKISWLKDTQQLSDSLSNIQRVLGNSLLAVWSAGSRDAGQYICLVENSAGTAHRRYNLVVRVPGKWSAWSHWSFCNATCGLGYQQRSRLCHYIDEYNVTIDKATKSDRIILDESECRGPTNDRRKCNMPACEDDETQMRWSAWSKWSACSATCGAGTLARTRRCKSKLRCHGDNVQITKCPDLPKCSKQDPPDNEVYSSKEGTTGTSAYIPEAIFEMQPEVVNTLSTPDVEDVYGKSDSTYSAVYYDVNVTRNLDGSDRGPCEPGYRHNTTTLSCDDIDECLIEKNQCHSTQTCVNTAGAYRCACAHGFRSLGAGQRCLDTNECEQDTHGCEYACVNVAGGYVCACPRHRRLHTDRHRCVTPSSYRKPNSYEELESEGYLSTSIDFPARYTKNTRKY